MTIGDKFIFVGGAARSGTTMVQNILDSHPDIVGGPQFRNIPDIIKLRNKLHNSIRRGKTSVFNSYEDIDKQICTLIENLLMPFFQKSQCKLLSEKTPTNIFVFRELMELFPSSHFIYVIRDPRAVISSNAVARSKFRKQGITFLDFSSAKLGDFINLTDWVRKSFIAGQEAIRVSSGKILTVVYERLVHQPEVELQNICDFLGIEWSSKMLYPSKQVHIGEESMTRAGICWHTKEGTFDRDIDTSSVDKWKRELSPVQKSIIAYYFRNIDILHRCDYDLFDFCWKEKASYRTFWIYEHLFQNIRVLRPFLKPLQKLKIGFSPVHNS